MWSLGGLKGRPYDRLFEYVIINNNRGFPEIILGPELIFAVDHGTAKAMAAERLLGGKVYDTNAMEKIEIKVREF